MCILGFGCAVHFFKLITYLFFEFVVNAWYIRTCVILFFITLLIEWVNALRNMS